jgi:hypothetical protein
VNAAETVLLPSCIAQCRTLASPGLRRTSQRTLARTTIVTYMTGQGLVDLTSLPKDAGLQERVSLGR